ncbi:MAG: hypothetical protein ACLSUW_00525 [Akkermansia sp.]
MAKDMHASLLIGLGATSMSVGVHPYIIRYAILWTTPVPGHGQRRSGPQQQGYRGLEHGPGPEIYPALFG